MMALRNSASMADVLLERKIRYYYAKIKAKRLVRTTPIRYALLKQHLSASATTEDTSLRLHPDVSSSYPTIIGGKRQSSRENIGHGDQKMSTAYGQFCRRVIRLWIPMPLYRYWF